MQAVLEARTYSIGGQSLESRKSSMAESVWAHVQKRWSFTIADVSTHLHTVESPTLCYMHCCPVRSKFKLKATLRDLNLMTTLCVNDGIAMAVKHPHKWSDNAALSFEEACTKVKAQHVGPWLATSGRQLG